MDNVVKDQLKLSEYDFVSQNDKKFVIQFDKAMQSIGYISDGIKPYVTFGKYKMEYTKLGNKTKKFIARFYFRDDGIVLRLYFNNIAKHSSYIENAPDYIKKPFINDYARCKHCDNGFNKDGKCNFRKSYTIDTVYIEKCSGDSFYFDNHELYAVEEYIKLIQLFYPSGKTKEGIVT